MVGTSMTRFGKILLILFGESEFTFCNTLYFRPEKLKTYSNSLFKNVMKKQAFDLTSIELRINKILLLSL